MRFAWRSLRLEAVSTDYEQVTYIAILPCLDLTVNYRTREYTIDLCVLWWKVSLSWGGEWGRCACGAYVNDPLKMQYAKVLGSVQCEACSDAEEKQRLLPVLDVTAWTEEP